MVPLLDEFPRDDDPTYIYTVMPLLCPYFFIEEVIDFMKRVLEVRHDPRTG